VYQVEKAKIADVPQIHKMVNTFADKGQMLARPLSEIYESVRDFFVIREGGQVIASAALHVCWDDLAEIRSVAVDAEMQGKGLGARIVSACLKEAENLGIKTVFCFTYRPEFFKRLNFVDIEKKELPRKVWTDCFRCPKFPDCDETALVYHGGLKNG
jgi:amino-acid N-acetyltransferase